MEDRDATVVRLDTRWLQFALGAAALVAIGAIGLVIGSGGAIGRAAATPSPQSASAAAAALATLDPTAAALATLGGPVLQVTMNLPTTVDGGQVIKPVVKGKSPVSLEEAAVGPAEARIWFTELVTDNWELALGDIAPDVPVERDVLIRNIGTGTLSLVDAGGTCGCTAVGLVAQDVAPGNTAIMKVKYDPRVSADAGKRIRKQLWVRSNDPLTPVAEFHITANVMPK